MSKDFLLKCIQEKASTEEMTRLKKWLEADTEHIRFYAELKNLWVASELKSSGTKDTDLPYIQKIIAITTTKPVVKQKNRKILYKTLVSIAAVGLLLLSVGGIQFLLKKTNAPDQIEVYVPRGERSEVTLCDGTKIFINSNTTLTYSRQFGSQTREVILKGEAYFQVAHNKAIPFIVRTSHFSVRVLGTEFNVKAYEEDNQVAAALDKGSIELTPAATKRPLLLKPGEEFMLQKNDGQTVIKHIDNQKNWLNNFIVVECLDINEFCKMLERNFNVSIDIDPAIDHQFEYNGRFKREKDIEEILDIMTKASPIKYIRKGDQITIQKK